MKKKVMIIIGIIIVVLIGAIAVVNHNIVEEEEEEQPVYEYTLGEPTVENDDYTCSIVGTLTNNGADKSYVQISIPFYDADGNKIGTAYDNVCNLKSGETWKYKATYIGDMEKGMSVSLENIEIVGY